MHGWVWKGHVRQHTISIWCARLISNLLVARDEKWEDKKYLNKNICVFFIM